ncbi:MAG: LTA synthase family protein [Acholeplasmatales bacterium]|nr:LTA synthase family protein [Acholeplasmatales bacterium]
MHQVLKMKAPLLLCYMLFFIIFQIMTFSYVHISGIPSYFMLDLLIALSLGSIIFMIKNRIASVVYLCIVMLLYMILFCTNAILFNIFGDVFSIEYLQVLNEAGEVFEWSYLKPFIMVPGILVFLAYVTINVLYIIFWKKDTYTVERSYVVTGMFTFIASLLTFGLIFSVNMNFANKTTKVNGELVRDDAFVKTLTKKAFKHYGMLGLYYKELSLEIRPSKKEIISPTDFESQSEYEGILEGKNVITIMVETLQSFSINKELTPNLYKMQEEAIYFNKNFSVNKTNMSEMIGITGSYYSFYDYNYDIDFALPNILKHKYKTTYVHDNNGSFYGRSKTMRYFGFENIVLHDDLYPEGFTNELYPDGINGWENDTWHWSGDYTLDSVTIDQALPYLIDENNLFYSFWTTLSMHGPYDGTGRYSNYSKWQKLGYLDKVKKAENNKTWINPLIDDAEYKGYLEYYECAVMDFDVALGKLLDALEEKDLLDDTLIVIYGDHEAYYHDIYLKSAHTSDKTRVDELYETTLIMYNKDLTDYYLTKNIANYYNTFTSPYVVAPTILDLLGVTFNKENYVNYSAFDNRYLPIFYSTQQKAFMNDNFYSYDGSKIEYAKDSSISSESFKRNAALTLNRLGVVDSLYESCRDKQTD